MEGGKLLRDGPLVKAAFFCCVFVKFLFNISAIDEKYISVGKFSVHSSDFCKAPATEVHINNSLERFQNKK